jgi:uncharacterized protein YuzE
MTATYCSDTDTLCIELREASGATTIRRVDGCAWLAVDRDGAVCRILICRPWEDESRGREPGSTPLGRPRVTVVC